MLYAEREARRIRRGTFDVPARMLLMEDDADENEREHAALRNEIRAVKSLLVGILISTSTAAVVGALNLVIK